MTRDIREIVRIIIMLASSLGLDVVAEGAETAAQVDELKKLNCEFEATSSQSRSTWKR